MNTESKEFDDQLFKKLKKKISNYLKNSKKKKGMDNYLKNSKRKKRWNIRRVSMPVGK